MSIEAGRLLTMFNVGTLTFGTDAVLRCATDLIESGARSVLIVTTPPTRGLCAPLVDALAGSVGVTLWDGLKGEPTVTEFADALAVARECRADAVVGLGGGSAMDVAKLVAALADGAQSIHDVVGSDLLTGRAFKLVCIPTTAGTGSEVTPIAILEDEAAQLKKGVVSRFLVPDAAYLDPRLTVSMPPAVTASTGFDALTHCIEAYANRFAHPIVDQLALSGMRLIVANIERAVHHGDDLEAREAMLLGALFGGMCLGPVNTAAVHALAYPLGGEFHVPHGVANALLLPHVLDFNIEVAADRYAEVARAMGVTSGSGNMSLARAGVEYLKELADRCGVQRRMSAFGVVAGDIPRMAAAAMTVQRLLVRNPREVTEADAARIYEAAL